MTITLYFQNTSNSQYINMKLNGLLYYRFYELSTWVAIYTLDFIFFLKDLNFLNKIVLCIYSIFPLKKKNVILPMFLPYCS